MYELYFSVGTACFAPLMVLEEEGLPFRLIETDIEAGAHQTPEYLAINPAGKVPALKLPNGEILTEASAICLYLADTHDLRRVAPGVDEPERAQFLRSLIFLATTLQDHFKRYYYPERYSSDPGHASAIEAKALDFLRDSFSVVDRVLSANGPYHLGERYSVADTYLVMLASWFPAERNLMKDFPAVGRCYDLVAARPCIKAGLDRQSMISVGQLESTR